MYVCDWDCQYIKILKKADYKRQCSMFALVSLNFTALFEFLCPNDPHCLSYSGFCMNKTIEKKKWALSL